MSVELNPDQITKLQANMRKSAGPHGALEVEDSGGLGAVPAFPIDVLPAAAQKLVAYGTKSALPPALVGGAAVAAIAAAIGPTATIEITPSWRQRPILWIALIAPRGAGKSPAQDLAFGPLRAHSQQSDDDDDEFVFGDTTLEALARDLHATLGGAALDVDELSVLLRGLGEYKRGGGADRGRFLQLWTGSQWTFRRVGSSGKQTNAVKLRIARPTLVICGGLQPALHDLLGGEEDGLRPRWLPHLAEMPTTQPALSSDHVPADWRQLLDHLVAVRKSERTWKLTDDAREAFGRHRKRWKRESKEPESASTAAALGKADNHLARYALVLAEAEHPGRGGAITSTLIDAAAEYVKFVLDGWRALPEQGGLALSWKDERLDGGIARLVAWLEEHGGESDRRTLQRNHVAGVRTPADLSALLGRYEATYPGTITMREPASGGIATMIVRAPRRRVRPVSPLATPPRVQAISPMIPGDSTSHYRGDTGIGDTGRGDTALIDGQLYIGVSPNGNTVAREPEAPVLTESFSGAADIEGENPEVVESNRDEHNFAAEVLRRHPKGKR